jgi:hypothetical protein
MAAKWKTMMRAGEGPSSGGVNLLTVNFRLPRVLVIHLFRL